MIWVSEQAPSIADFLARIAFLEAAVCARDTTIAERDEQLRRERTEADFASSACSCRSIASTV